MAHIPGRVSATVSGIKGCHPGSHYVLHLGIHGADGGTKQSKTATVEGGEGAVRLSPPLETSQNVAPPTHRPRAWTEVAGYVEVVVAVQRGDDGRERRVGDLAIPLRSLVDPHPASGRQSASVEDAWMPVQHCVEATVPQVQISAVLRLPPGLTSSSGGGSARASTAGSTLKWRGQVHSDDEGGDDAYDEDEWDTPATDAGEEEGKEGERMNSGGGGRGRVKSGAGAQPRTRRRSADGGVDAASPAPSSFAELAALMKSTATAVVDDGGHGPASVVWVSSGSTTPAQPSTHAERSESRPATVGAPSFPLLNASLVSAVTSASSNGTQASPDRMHAQASPDRTQSTSLVSRASHASQEYDDDDFEVEEDEDDGGGPGVSQAGGGNAIRPQPAPATDSKAAEPAVHAITPPTATGADASNRASDRDQADGKVDDAAALARGTAPALAVAPGMEPAWEGKMDASLVIGVVEESGHAAPPSTPSAWTRPATSRREGKEEQEGEGGVVQPGTLADTGPSTVTYLSDTATRLMGGDSILAPLSPSQRATSPLAATAASLSSVSSASLFTSLVEAGAGGGGPSPRHANDQGGKEGDETVMLSPSQSTLVPMGWVGGATSPTPPAVTPAPTLHELLQPGLAQHDATAYAFATVAWLLTSATVQAGDEGRHLWCSPALAPFVASHAPALAAMGYASCIHPITGDAAVRLIAATSPVGAPIISTLPSPIQAHLRQVMATLTHAVAAALQGLPPPAWELQVLINDPEFAASRGSLAARRVGVLGACGMLVEAMANPVRQPAAARLWRININNRVLQERVVRPLGMAATQRLMRCCGFVTIGDALVLEGSPLHRLMVDDPATRTALTTAPSVMAALDDPLAISPIPAALPALPPSVVTSLQCRLITLVVFLTHLQALLHADAVPFPPASDSPTLAHVVGTAMPQWPAVAAAMAGMHRRPPAVLDAGVGGTPIPDLPPTPTTVPAIAGVSDVASAMASPSPPASRTPSGGASGRRRGSLAGGGPVSPSLILASTSIPHTDIATMAIPSLLHGYMLARLPSAGGEGGVVHTPTRRQAGGAAGGRRRGSLAAPAAGYIATAAMDGQWQECVATVLRGAAGAFGARLPNATTSAGITVTDLRIALAVAGAGLETRSEAALAGWIRGRDLNGDGVVSWPEFAASCGAVMVAPASPPPALELAAASTTSPRARPRPGGGTGGSGKERAGLAAHAMQSVQQARAAFHREAWVAMRTAAGVVLFATRRLLQPSLAAGMGVGEVGAGRAGAWCEGAPPDPDLFPTAFSHPQAMPIVHTVAAFGLLQMTAHPSAVQRGCAWLLRLTAAVLHQQSSESGGWVVPVANTLVPGMGHMAVGRTVSAVGAAGDGDMGGGMPWLCPGEWLHQPGMVQLLAAFGWEWVPGAGACVLGGRVEAHADWPSLPPHLAARLAACAAILRFFVDIAELEQVPSPAAALLACALLVVGGRLSALFATLHTRSQAADVAAQAAIDAHRRRLDAPAASQDGKGGASNPAQRGRSRSAPGRGGGKAGARADDDGVAQAAAAAAAVYRDDASLDAFIVHAPLAGPGVAAWVSAVEWFTTHLQAMVKASAPSDPAFRLSVRPPATSSTSSLPTASTTSLHSPPGRGGGTGRVGMGEGGGAPCLPSQRPLPWPLPRAAGQDGGDVEWLPVVTLYTAVGFREVEGSGVGTGGGVLACASPSKPLLACRLCEWKACLPLLKATAAAGTSLATVAVFHVPAEPGALDGSPATLVSPAPSTGHAHASTDSITTASFFSPTKPASSAAAVRGANMTTTAALAGVGGDGGELASSSTLRFVGTESLPSGMGSWRDRFDLTGDGGGGQGRVVHRAGSEPPRLHTWRHEPIPAPPPTLPASSNTAVAAADLASRHEALAVASRSEIAALRAALQAAQAELKAAELRQARRNAADVVAQLQRTGVVTADDAARLRAAAQLAPAPPGSPALGGGGARQAASRPTSPPPTSRATSAERGRTGAAGGKATSKGGRRSSVVAGGGTTPAGSSTGTELVVTSVDGVDRCSIIVQHVTAVHGGDHASDGGSEAGVPVAPGHGVVWGDGTTCLANAVAPAASRGTWSVSLDASVPAAISAPALVNVVVLPAAEVAQRCRAAVEGWIRHTLLHQLAGAAVAAGQARVAMRAADFEFGHRRVAHPVLAVGMAWDAPVPGAPAPPDANTDGEDDARSPHPHQELRLLSVVAPGRWSWLEGSTGGVGGLTWAPMAGWCDHLYHLCDPGATGAVTMADVVSCITTHPLASTWMAAPTSLAMHPVARITPATAGDHATLEPPPVQPTMSQIWRRLPDQPGHVVWRAHAMAALFRAIHPLDHLILAEADMDALLRAHIHPTSDILRHTSPDFWGNQWDAAQSAAPLDDDVMMAAASVFAEVHAHDYVMTHAHDSADEAAACGVTYTAAQLFCTLLDGVPLPPRHLQAVHHGAGDGVTHSPASRGDHAGDGAPRFTFADIMAARAMRDRRIIDRVGGVGVDDGYGWALHHVVAWPIPGLPRRLLALQAVQRAYAAAYAAAMAAGHAVTMRDVLGEMGGSGEGRKVAGMMVRTARGDVAIGHALTLALGQGHAPWYKVYTVAGAALMGVQMGWSSLLPPPLPTLTWTPSCTSPPVVLDAVATPDGRCMYALTSDGMLECRRGSHGCGGGMVWRHQVLTVEAAQAVAQVRRGGEADAHARGMPHHGAHPAALGSMLQLVCPPRYLAEEGGAPGGVIHPATTHVLALNAGAAAWALAWAPTATHTLVSPGGVGGWGLGELQMWGADGGGDGPYRIASAPLHFATEATLPDGCGGSIRVTTATRLWPTEFAVDGVHQLVIAVVPAVALHPEARGSHLLAACATTGTVIAHLGCMPCPSSPSMPLHHVTWCSATHQVVAASEPAESEGPRLVMWDGRPLIARLRSFRAALVHLAAATGPDAASWAGANRQWTQPVPIHQPPAAVMNVSHALAAFAAVSSGWAGTCPPATHAASITCMAPACEGAALITTHADGTMCVWHTCALQHRRSYPPVCWAPPLEAGVDNMDERHTYDPAAWTPLPRGYELKQPTPPPHQMALVHVQQVTTPQHAASMTVATCTTPMGLMPGPGVRTLVGMGVWTKAQATLSAWGVAPGSASPHPSQHATCGYLYILSDGSVEAVGVRPDASALDLRWLCLSDEAFLTVDGAAAVVDDASASALLRLRARLHASTPPSGGGTHVVVVRVYVVVAAGPVSLTTLARVVGRQVTAGTHVQHAAMDPLPPALDRLDVCYQALSAVVDGSRGVTMTPSLAAKAAAWASSPPDPTPHPVGATPAADANPASPPPWLPVVALFPFYCALTDGPQVALAPCTGMGMTPPPPGHAWAMVVRIHAPLITVQLAHECRTVTVQAGDVIPAAASGGAASSEVHVGEWVWVPHGTHPPAPSPSPSDAWVCVTYASGSNGAWRCQALSISSMLRTLRVGEVGGDGGDASVATAWSRIGSALQWARMADMVHRRFDAVRHWARAAAWTSRLSSWAVEDDAGVAGAATGLVAYHGNGSSGTVAVTKPPSSSPRGGGLRYDVVLSRVCRGNMAVWCQAAVDAISALVRPQSAATPIPAAPLAALAAMWHLPWFRWALAPLLNRDEAGLAPGGGGNRPGLDATQPASSPGATHNLMTLAHAALPAFHVHESVAACVEVQVASGRDVCSHGPQMARGTVARPLLPVWDAAADVSTDAGVPDGWGALHHAPWHDVRRAWLAGSPVSTPMEDVGRAGVAAVCDWMWARRHGVAEASALTRHPAASVSDAINAVGAHAAASMAHAASSGSHVVPHATSMLLALELLQAVREMVGTTWDSQAGASSATGVGEPDARIAACGEALRALWASLPHDKVSLAWRDGFVTVVNDVMALLPVHAHGVTSGADTADAPCRPISHLLDAGLVEAATLVAMAGVHTAVTTSPPPPHDHVVPVMASVVGLLQAMAACSRLASIAVEDGRRLAGVALRCLRHVGMGRLPWCTRPSTGDPGTPTLAYAHAWWPVLEPVLPSLLGVAEDGGGADEQEREGEPTVPAMLMQSRLVRPCAGFMPRAAILPPMNNGPTSGDVAMLPRSPSFLRAATMALGVMNAASAASGLGDNDNEGQEEGEMAVGAQYWSHWAELLRVVANLAATMPDPVVDLPAAGVGAPVPPRGGAGKPSAASMGAYVRWQEQMGAYRAAMARISTLLLPPSTSPGSEADTPPRGAPVAMQLMLDLRLHDLIAHMLHTPTVDVRATAFHLAHAALVQTDAVLRHRGRGPALQDTVSERLARAVQMRFTALDVVVACTRQLTPMLHRHAAAGPLAKPGGGARMAARRSSLGGGGGMGKGKAVGTTNEEDGVVTQAAAAVQLLAAQSACSTFQPATWRTCGVFSLIARCAQAGPAAGAAAAVASACIDLLQRACCDVHDDNVLALVRMDAHVQAWMRGRGIALPASMRHAVSSAVRDMVEVTEAAARMWADRAAAIDARIGGRGAGLEEGAHALESASSPRVADGEGGELAALLRRGMGHLPIVRSIIMAPALHVDAGVPVVQPLVLASWTLATVAWSAVAATSPTQALHSLAVAWCDAWLRVCTAVQRDGSDADLLTLLSAVPTAHTTSDAWPGVDWLTQCCGAVLPPLPFDADSGRGVQGAALQFAADVVASWASKMHQPCSTSAMAGLERLLHAGVVSALHTALHAHADLMRVAMHHKTAHVHLLANGGRDVAAGLAGRGALWGALLRVALAPPAIQDKGCGHSDPAARPPSPTAATEHGGELATAAIALSHSYAQALCECGVFTSLLCDIAGDASFVDVTHIALPPPSAVFGSRHPVRLEATALAWTAAVAMITAEAHRVAEQEVVATAVDPVPSPPQAAHAASLRGGGTLVATATVVRHAHSRNVAVRWQGLALLQGHVAEVVVSQGVVAMERQRLWTTVDASLQTTVCAMLQAILFMAPNNSHVRTALEAVGLPPVAVAWMNAVRHSTSSAQPQRADRQREEAHRTVETAGAVALAGWSTWRADRFKSAPTSREQEVTRGVGWGGTVPHHAAMTATTASLAATTARAVSRLGDSLRRSWEGWGEAAIPSTPPTTVQPPTPTAVATVDRPISPPPSAAPAPAPAVATGDRGGRAGEGSSVVAETAAVLARMGDAVVDVKEAYDAHRHRTTIARGAADTRSLHGDVAATHALLAAIAADLGLPYTPSQHAALTAAGYFPAGRCTFSQFVRVVGHLMDETGGALTPAHLAMVAAREEGAHAAPVVITRRQHVATALPVVQQQVDPADVLRSVFERFAVPMHTAAGVLVRAVPTPSIPSALSTLQCHVADAGQLEALLIHVGADPSLGLTLHQLHMAWHTMAMGGGLEATDAESVISALSTST